METLELLYQSILKGKTPETIIYTQKALEENIPPQEIISKGMNSAMEEVGLRFSQHELFLPEMMIAARAMKEGMGVIEPRIVGESVTTMGKIVLGTIKGDLHDVGKNLVAMMFKGSGFDVVDLGVDVPKEKFLESIRQESPEFVGISALLATTLPNVIETIDLLRSSGIDKSCRILVGGAPVTPEFAKDAKADGYSPDAGLAIQIAKTMIGK
jgi:5-methyltetrahydrofolate--homocysteine methyltransferase